MGFTYRFHPVDTDASLKRYRVELECPEGVLDIGTTTKRRGGWVRAETPQGGILGSWHRTRLEAARELARHFVAQKAAYLRYLGYVEDAERWLKLEDPEGYDPERDDFPNDTDTGPDYEEDPDAMTMQELDSITDGAGRTITKVKITEQSGGPATKRSDVTWEFQCDHCDTMDTGLTEAEARDELSGHVCPEDRDEF